MIKDKYFKILVFIIECNIHKICKEQSLQFQGKITITTKFVNLKLQGL